MENGMTGLEMHNDSAGAEVVRLELYDILIDQLDACPCSCRIASARPPLLSPPHRRASADRLAHEQRMNSA